MDIQYFLGANSADGFFSRYGDLQPEAGRRLTRILKGGPGCGKSTLMKKVAACAAERGLDTERILCSSDPDSLDGIVVPAAGYAIVDGTAPHVVEPVLCGFRESYLNLGRGYDTAAMSSCGGALREIQDAAARCYPPATAALRAAAALEPLLTGSGELTPALARSICSRELPMHGGSGSIRRCFLSGHTPKGLLCCWGTVAAQCGRVYALRGSRAEIGAFLQAAAEEALRRGWAIRLCDSPLLPGRCAEHLLIPDCGLAFVSDSPLLPYTGPRLQTLGSHPQQRELCAAQRALLETAISHLRRAKEYHDLLEHACAPYVDFSAADQAARECCAELELLCAQAHSG